MASFPHEYTISTAGGPDGVLPLAGENVPELETSAPPEFGGPEGYWSPETMLTGAVANCLILTFRALAQPARIGWSNLEVSCTGKVEKTSSGIRFTKFAIEAALTITGDTDEGKARQILDNAKKYCLITASLNAETEMQAEVRKA